MTTVLVAEENDSVRKLLCRILQRQGYEVLAAPNAGEALELGRGHPAPLDLLLADMIFPQMTATELAGQLAASRPRMKVIYMSGYSSEHLQEKGLLKPGLPFLQKPFTSDALLRAVRTVLES